MLTALSPVKFLLFKYRSQKMQTSLLHQGNVVAVISNPLFTLRAANWNPDPFHTLEEVFCFKLEVKYNRGGAWGYI